MINPDSSPYAQRDDHLLLQSLLELTRLHACHCAEYSRIIGDSYSNVTRIPDVPFLHAGIFKAKQLTSTLPEQRVARTVSSSSTSGRASMISQDERSAALQARSSEYILGEFIGSHRRPFLILDAVSSLRTRSAISARIMAALSLKPFASDMFFLLRDSGDHLSVDAERLECAVNASDELLVYGFSWMLWLFFTEGRFSPEVLKKLKERRVTFVHSGGWKKLESERVVREQFDARLLSLSAPGSIVVDYYGLVEQMGIVYPLCESGRRHVPRWADVIIRDSWTLQPLSEDVGQIQLLNCISFGSPCHSVLTEDLGRMYPDPCRCGRSGRTFELLGRVPRAEVRGCSNV